MQSFTVKPPQREPGLAETDQPSHEKVDQHLKVRVRVTAGPHLVGVTFPEETVVAAGNDAQPYQTHFNSTGIRGSQPAVYPVSIIGPYAATRPGRHAQPPADLRVAAGELRATKSAAPGAILAALMRRAYRRPVDGEDLQGPLEFYRKARAEGDFDAGIEMALSAVLVNPQFLFRIERDPPAFPPDTAYRVSDVELASRLSFFLWSSIPDDELLDLAAAGQLARAGGARAASAADAGRSAVALAGHQFRRRSGCTCAIWTRSLPTCGCFPTSTTTCGRRCGRRRSCSSRASCARTAACSICCSADYTYLNERLAKHYGIPARLRQPLPPRRARRGQSARRAAAPGQHPDGDFVCDAHVAGDSRQVGARKPARRAAPAAAARCAGAEGQHRGRPARRCASGWPSTASNAACAGCHN